MNSEKPKNIDEYRKWLKKEYRIDISNRTKTYYESVTSRVKMDLEESDFWVRLTENLREYHDEYLVEKRDPLWIGEFKPKVYIKPYDSFLLKSFRKNILENKRWPDEPKDGWILPNNWYTKINDIIRTLFVVKYMDGVEFMMDKIKSLCEHLDMKCRSYLEAREEGYYAGHLYIKQEFEIQRVNWDTERVDVFLEIQITTQLQEVIRKLIHRHYEERRKKIKEEYVKWQWDYKSNEFAANYLGHILHYVEGMIMKIRERQ